MDRYATSRVAWATDETSTPARVLLREALREAVTTALTDKQREVVEACFFEGLSQGEIARQLGVAQQVVQRRLYGATRGGRRIGGAIAKLHAALASMEPAPSRVPS